MALKKTSDGEDMDELRKVLDGKTSGDEELSGAVRSVKRHLNADPTQKKRVSSKRPTYHSTSSKKLDPEITIGSLDDKEEISTVIQDPSDSGPYDLELFRVEDLYEVEKQKDIEVAFIEVHEKPDSKYIPSYDTRKHQEKDVIPIKKETKGFEKSKRKTGKTDTISLPKSAIKATILEEESKKKPKSKPVVTVEPVIQHDDIEEELEEDTPDKDIILEEEISNVFLESFKGMESIDATTAELLYENGIMSPGDIKESSVNDLVHIEGIKRKLAKKIKKEVNEMDVAPEPTKTTVRTTEPIEWQMAESDDEETSSAPVTPNAKYSYGEYGLYEKEIMTKSGKKRMVRFFSKTVPEIGESIDLPVEYEVRVNKKTGLPYLRKRPE